MKLKDKCCKSYKKKGKACKRCPLVHCASESKLTSLAKKISKKSAYKTFCKNHLCASA